MMVFVETMELVESYFVESYFVEMMAFEGRMKSVEMMVFVGMTELEGTLKTDYQE
jgi:hypothetical protein